MRSPGQTKICGICGEDCSTRARTKDKSGKYFCKACYESAVEKSRLQDAVSTPQSYCQNCNAPMSSDAVLCVSCGFNSSSSQSVNTAIDKTNTSRIPRGLVGPVLLAVIPTLLWTGLFLWAKNDMIGFGIFVLLIIFASGGYLLWMLRAASKISSSTATACYAVPFYFLYFVFWMNSGKYLKGATIQYLVSISLMIVVFLGPKPKINDPMATWEQQMNQPIQRDWPNAKPNTPSPTPPAADSASP